MSNERHLNAPDDLDDYRWLVSDEAAPWLERASLADEPALTIARRLRKQLPAGRVRHVLQQANLRRRAQQSGKFPDGDRMFFTPILLEQATSQLVARHKAQRFAADAFAADLCCGVGGDLMALAERGQAVGVDRDPVAAILADANCRAAQCEARVEQADACTYDVGSLDAWHIDPDRRPAGRRTTRPELHQPSLQQIDRLLQAAPAAAIKLAPAAILPERWAAEAELEWIGEARQCKQLVAWFGELAIRTGHRRATVIRDANSPPATVMGQPDEPIVPAQRVARYIYEPHATVLAANLAGAVAAPHGLEGISADGGYLTSEQLVTSSILAAFEVTDTLPLDIKRLKAALRERNMGRLVVKKRGLDVHPQKMQRQLRVPGDEPCVLLLTKFAGRAVAILAHRISELSPGTTANN